MSAALVAQSAFGFFALHALAWAVSDNRRGVVWRPVLMGMALTLALAALFLKVPAFSDAFLVLNRAVDALERATQAGTSFVFGYLGGAPLPFEETAGDELFRARIPGAAARARHQRAVVAALLLARAAVDRAAFRAPARAHDGRGRRGRPVGRGERVRRAWSRRRCSCGRTSRACRAASSS